jgi:hypothetical protein
LSLARTAPAGVRKDLGQRTVQLLEDSATPAQARRRRRSASRGGRGEKHQRAITGHRFGTADATRAAIVRSSRGALIVAAASGQRPAASGQRPAASGQRPAASGQPKSLSRRARLRQCGQLRIHSD